MMDKVDQKQVHRQESSSVETLYTANDLAARMGISGLPTLTAHIDRGTFQDYATYCTSDGTLLWSGDAPSLALPAGAAAVVPAADYLAQQELADFDFYATPCTTGHIGRYNSSHLGLYRRGKVDFHTVLDVTHISYLDKVREGTDAFAGFPASTPTEAQDIVDAAELTRDGRAILMDACTSPTRLRDDYPTGTCVDPRSLTVYTPVRESRESRESRDPRRHLRDHPRHAYRR